MLMRAHLLEHRIVCLNTADILERGQVAKALGRNILQGSIHERPGKTRDSDVTQQVLSCTVFSVMATPGHSKSWA